MIARYNNSYCVYGKLSEDACVSTITKLWIIRLKQ